MTDEAALPSDVRALVQDRVHSIEQLEALQLLSRERERAFLAPEVATALRLPLDAARSALEELVHAGFVRASVETPLTFQYAPRDEALAARVDQLVAAYATHRVELLVLISKSAMNRVRTGALRTFSEAFRLRRPKKDG